MNTTRSLKRTGLGVMAGLVAVGLAACSGGTGGDASSDTNLTVWLMDSSVPDSAIEWLETTFAEQHEGATLTVVEQQWEGIVDKLQTALPSASDTPDLVEVGNTQTSTFSSVGAFSPISDEVLAAIGGDALSASGLESGTWDGQVYATPLYQGARIIFYRADLLAAAGIAVPETLDELNAAAIALNAANPEGTEDFSGIYLPAIDAHNLEGWLFTYGGAYAVEDGDGWVPALSTDESIAALEKIQTLLQEGTTYSLDSAKDNQTAPELFAEGKLGFISYLNFAEASIPEEMFTSGQVGVMALPGLTAGTYGSPFAGGSNVAISAASPNQELAQAALELIYSAEFQSALASEGGWVPGNTDYASELQGVTADAAAIAVEHSKLTPTTPAWGVADSSGVLTEFWTRIANGEDVTTVAAETDALLADILTD